MNDTLSPGKKEIHKQVLVETFKKKGGKNSYEIRVRALEIFDQNWHIVFPKHLPNNHPWGTRFRTDLTLVEKQDSKLPYLVAKPTSIKIVTGDAAKVLPERVGANFRGRSLQSWKKARKATLHKEIDKGFQNESETLYREELAKDNISRFKIFGGILIVIFITFCGVIIDINPAFAVLVACLGIGITIHGIANQGFPIKPDHLKENEENDK